MTQSCPQIVTLISNDIKKDSQKLLLSQYTEFSKRKAVSERWNILCSNTSEVLYEILLKII